MPGGIAHGAEKKQTALLGVICRLLDKLLTIIIVFITNFRLVIG